MSAPTFAERWRIARLASRQRRQARLVRSLALPLARLARSGAVDELLIVPSSLRTPDPSFADEIAAGAVGLAGEAVQVGAGSPFAIEDASLAWRTELHGFAWLNHLAAAGGPRPQASARRLVIDWIDRCSASSGIEWRPDVVARRIISWLSHAGLILEGADSREYDRVMLSLGAQIGVLESTRRAASPGARRLLCQLALLLSALALKRREGALERAEAQFRRELGAQILADGGHISRKPDTVLDLLLDLLPLRQCYVARERPVPADLADTIQRMLAFLARMRLGDGSIARFNGMGATRADAVATVLAFQDAQIAAPAIPASRYVRLAAAETVLIMDCGSPPSIELAGEAAAGCLSFELSAGDRAVFVNGGAPGPGFDSERPAARATASHNTLCLDNRSSARLIVSPRVEQVCGGPVIVGPSRVDAEIAKIDGRVSIEASHHGYAETLGLIHRRRIALSADGRIVEGVDRLLPRYAGKEARNLPFAIHFHLDPGALAQAVGSSEIAIALPGRAGLLMTVAGAEAVIEGSVDYDHALGPREARQIVLRAVAKGEATVTWTLRPDDRQGAGDSQAQG